MKTLKPALTIDGQISKLEQHGVVIENREHARKILGRINYYRLTGYLLPYKHNGEMPTFKGLCSILVFDQKLRNEILKYMEHVEVALRTFLVDVFAFLDDKNGMAYLNPIYYRNEYNFTKWKSTKLDESIRMSDELFITHYDAEYGGSYPIWVALEVVSIGTLSRMYELLSAPL